jgi:hypothetical protein
MTFKEFLVGAGISALAGLWFYSSARQESVLLRQEIRRQEIEKENNSMQTLEFIARISEMEKNNVEHYNHIVDTTKQYANIISEEVKDGRYEKYREMIALYRKLGSHSNRIESNNKQIFDAIKQYVSARTQKTGSMEF